jgi:hypothetical protein
MTLRSGKYALCEIITTLNPQNNKTEKLTIIETIEIKMLENGNFIATPLDKTTKYFTNAVGYADRTGKVIFGFTLLKNKKLYSVNYSGNVTIDRYIRGKLIAIFPGAEAAIKGDWAMKEVDDKEDPKKIDFWK